MLRYYVIMLNFAHGEKQEIVDAIFSYHLGIFLNLPKSSDIILYFDQKSKNLLTVFVYGAFY